MDSLSVVIPAYNEEKTIENTLNTIAKFLQERKIDFEIIVIDDGSADGTSEITKSKLKNQNKYQDPNSKNQSFDTFDYANASSNTQDDIIKLISYKANKGKGYAVRQGVMAATKEWILMTDADMSTPIYELDNFMNHLNSDFIIGSRAVDRSKVILHQPAYRELGGKVLNKIIRVITGLDINDTQCGFKLMRADAAKKVFSETKINGYAFDVEVLKIAKSKGYEIIELPVEWRNRKESRVNPFIDGLKTLLDILKI